MSWYHEYHIFITLELFNMAIAAIVEMAEVNGLALPIHHDALTGLVEGCKQSQVFTSGFYHVGFTILPSPSKHVAKKSLEINHQHVF